MGEGASKQSQNVEKYTAPRPLPPPVYKFLDPPLLSVSESEAWLAKMRDLKQLTVIQFAICLDFSYILHLQCSLLNLLA